MNLDKAGTEKPGRDFFCQLENNFVARGNKNPLICATAVLPIEVFRVVSGALAPSFPVTSL